MNHREHVEEMIKIAIFSHVGLMHKEAMTGNFAASIVKRPATQMARAGGRLNIGDFVANMFGGSNKKIDIAKTRSLYARTGVPGSGYSTSSHRSRVAYT